MRALAVPCLSLIHVNAGIVSLGCTFTITVLGLDLYAIKNGEIFDDLKRHCLDCIFPESCAADLRCDPNNPGWETYCPNAAMLGGELVEAKWFKQR